MVAAAGMTAPPSLILTAAGLRKNGIPQPFAKRKIRLHIDFDDPGKQWHAQKSAFRPTAGIKSYEKRAAERTAMSAMKAKEKEMKDEKEDERQV